MRFCFIVRSLDVRRTTIIAIPQNVRLERGLPGHYRITYRVFFQSVLSAGKGSRELRAFIFVEKIEPFERNFSRTSANALARFANLRRNHFHFSQDRAETNYTVVFGRQTVTPLLKRSVEAPSVYTLSFNIDIDEN